jgi:hypothetical protein
MPAAAAHYCLLVLPWYFRRCTGVAFFPPAVRYFFDAARLPSLFLAQMDAPKVYKWPDAYKCELCDIVVDENKGNMPFSCRHCGGKNHPNLCEKCTCVEYETWRNEVLPFKAPFQTRAVLAANSSGLLFN